jgi:protein SCO1/2
VPSPTPRRHPLPKRITDARATLRLALATATLATVTAATGWVGCGSGPLPILGTVPPFTLVDRSGTAVAAADLAGRVWVADFIFTRCPDICPALTRRLASLQDDLGSGPDPVRLVSISVDPLHDTPAVLGAYAERMGARASWLFLTGSRDAVATLLKDGFRVAWADDGPPSAPITHSDRFVLVDRALRVRGYYHGGLQEDVARLRRDALAVRDSGE